MKLSDINFSAIEQMMNRLSPEEKASLDSMARDMMGQMNPEGEPDVDYTEGLGLSDAYQQLDGRTLDALEAAWDMENFYDQDPEADYSAAVLFYEKAVLAQLRHDLFPLAKAIVNFTGHSLKEFVSMLDETAVQAFVQEGIGTEAAWNALRLFLSQLVASLYLAESEPVTYEQLQGVKQAVLAEGGLLQIQEIL